MTRKCAMPRAPRRLALALLTTLLVLHAPTRTLQSQPLNDVFLRRGDRVRVEFAPDTGTARTARVTGVFDRAEAGTVSVRLADGAVLTSPLARVRRIRVSDGRQPLTKQGMTVGLITGSVVGAIAGLSEEPNEYFSRPVYAVAGAVVLGLAGGVAGGIVGAILRGEKWSDVPASIPLRRARLDPYLSGTAPALRVRVTF
jgi:hypothetical protein